MDRRDSFGKTSYETAQDNQHNAIAAYLGEVRESRATAGTVVAPRSRGPMVKIVAQTRQTAFTAKGQRVPEDSESCVGMGVCACLAASVFHVLRVCWYAGRVMTMMRSG